MEVLVTGVGGKAVEVLVNSYRSGRESCGGISLRSGGNMFLSERKVFLSGLPKKNVDFPKKKVTFHRYFDFPKKFRLSK